MTDPPDAGSIRKPSPPAAESGPATHSVASLRARLKHDKLLGWTLADGAASGDSKSDYFNGEIGEPFVDAFAQVPALRAPARTCSFGDEFRNLDTRHLEKEFAVPPVHFRLEGESVVCR